MFIQPMFSKSERVMFKKGTYGHFSFVSIVHSILLLKQQLKTKFRT